MTNPMNPKFAAALLAARKAAKPIVKNATNPFLKNKYADLATVIESVVTALTDAGVFVMQSSSPENNGILVHTTLVHAETGEAVSSHVWSPLAGNKPQDAMGAFTYGRRYGLLSALCMPTEDDDGNAASGVEEQAKAAADAMFGKPTQKPLPAIPGKK